MIVSQRHISEATADAANRRHTRRHNGFNDETSRPAKPAVSAAERFRNAYRELLEPLRTPQPSGISLRRGKAFIGIVKIATFNINGINGRLENLLRWLEDAQPSVVCLQEIKCRNADFPSKALEAAGYGSIHRGQGPHHGVAILARGVDPIETRRSLPGDSGDVEARYIEAAVNGVLVGCLYLPNGNPQPGPKFTYKLAWFERLIAYAAELQASGAPVVLAGDYNVVPTDADIYSMRSWHANALVQPAPRAAFVRLVGLGWTDALRELHPFEPHYTFWHYLRNAWDRDAGMRIDHLLVSGTIGPRLAEAGVDRSVRARENASDHAPAWITLRDDAISR